MINSLKTDSQLFRGAAPSLSMRNLDHREKTECQNVNKNDFRGKRETADVNFCGLSPNEAQKDVKWIYRSNFVKSSLMLAEKNQLVFGAAFALLLTCVLRPLSIIAIPESKKNKDDKIYAAAHSISSGLIGFGITSIAFAPIIGGIKRGVDKKSDYISKAANKIKDPKVAEIAGTTLNRLPDIVGAIPKGILTIAIIPPLLKYAFNIEKGKSGQKTDLKTTPDYSLLNFKNSATNKAQFAAFQGGNK